MIVPKGKIEKAVATEKSGRYVLQHVHLKTDPDGSRWLEATDSYKLVRVPAEQADDDADGLIPAAAFVEARKVRTGGSVSSTTDGAVSYTLKAGGTAATRLGEGQFPKSEQLFPVDEPVFTVGLNARYLLDIAEALGANLDNVVIAFAPDKGDPSKPSALRPMVVTGQQSEGKALLMPVRIGS